MSFFNFSLENGLRNNGSKVIVRQGNGHGSTNTKIRRWSTIILDRGSSITYLDDSSNGASFTINENGLYCIVYTDFKNTSARFGLSLNSTQLTTNIDAINALNWLCETSTSAANQEANCTVTKFFQKNDIIRGHTQGDMNGATADNKNVFTIELILKL